MFVVVFIPEICCINKIREYKNIKVWNRGKNIILQDLPGKSTDLFVYVKLIKIKTNEKLHRYFL